jgi:hypothetical protein
MPASGAMLFQDIQALEDIGQTEKTRQNHQHRMLRLIRKHPVPIPNHIHEGRSFILVPWNLTQIAVSRILLLHLKVTHSEGI